MRFNLIDILNVSSKGEEFYPAYGVFQPSDEYNFMFLGIHIIASVTIVIGLGAGLVLLLKKMFKKKIEEQPPEELYGIFEPRVEPKNEPKSKPKAKPRFNPPQVLYGPPQSFKDDTTIEDGTENK